MREYAQPPIDDYALIGDCRSAALVSLDGSIDWLCWPRFDSPSVFAAILDQQRGGSFSVRPATLDAVPARRYIPGTNVLETTWTTPSGRLVVRDLMPVASEEAKLKLLLPEREVLREIEVTEGSVEVEISYQPQPGYGANTARLDDRGAEGIWCRDGGHALVLRSSLPLGAFRGGGHGVHPG